MISRLFALLICLSAVAGIGLEAQMLMRGGATLAEAVWSLARFFTILTNGVIATLFGWIAVKGPGSVSPRLTGGAVAAIVLVGVVFALLLSGARVLTGATAVSDFLLHRLNPLLAAAYWLLFVPKGRLSWRDPILWMAYPLAYLAYALARGGSDGRYPYPFIDVPANGWPTVIGTCAVIALGFVAASEGLVLLDRTLGRRKP